MTDEMLALIAMGGDRDEPRALFAWVVALNGRLNVLSELVEKTAELAGREDNAHWRAAARACDGLDIRAAADAVEAAFDELGLVERALERGIAEHNSR